MVFRRIVKGRSVASIPDCDVALVVAVIGRVSVIAFIDGFICDRDVAIETQRLRRKPDLQSDIPIAFMKYVSRQRRDIRWACLLDTSSLYVNMPCPYQKTET